MPKTTHTDEQLINLIKADNKAAFRMLFDRHYKTLLATAINMLKDVDSAKDATQEVFLQIWSKRDTLNINTNPLAYLKRAVINRSLNQIKSKKRIVEESQMAEMQSSNTEATENLAAQDLEVVMKKALDTLPERCRMIFVMRRLEGISLKEIAQQLEISPKTVENQITKALKVLQKAVRPFVEKEN